MNGPTAREPACGINGKDSERYGLKPNSITLASSELAPNMFGAGSELASLMEFGFYQMFASSHLYLTRQRLPVP